MYVEGFQITNRWSQGLPPPEEQVSEAGSACTGSPELMRTVSSAFSILPYNALHSCFCFRTGLPQYAHCPCMQQAHIRGEVAPTYELCTAQLVARTERQHNVGLRAAFRQQAVMGEPGPLNTGTTSLITDFKSCGTGHPPWLPESRRLPPEPPPVILAPNRAGCWAAASAAACSARTSATRRLVPSLPRPHLE